MAPLWYIFKLPFHIQWYSLYGKHLYFYDKVIELLCSAYLYDHHANFTCHNCLLFFNKFWFKLIYLKSITKQVIPTYINHSRPLIPDDIHLFYWTMFWEEREFRPVLISWTPSKEATGTISKTSLVWRGRGSNPRPPAYGANALTTEPPLRGGVLFV